ncbi:cation-translocating P-type ATPase [Streptomyces barringtoniae]|uniref:cation-translocating P-type ATPase n=1 Tax=Streptomyces barringtoniae TaxID=2892029 RepID=UPI001E65AFBA|nr:cation-translocating P-type ATPase [Streptomyces barringtoniae]MCC5475771.1 cation-translocating P-type ATPase [Streptomyces barringtoniae]
MSLLSEVRLPLPLSAPLTGGSGCGVTAGVRAAAHVAAKLLGLERRDVWSRSGRCHIEVRGVRGPRGMSVGRSVERALEEHPGVLWARVNAAAERVVVELASPPPPQQELIEIVVRAEAREAAAPAEPGAYDEWCPQPLHPCEGPRWRSAVPVLAADIAGLLLTAATRVSPWTPLPAEVGALASAALCHPWLRRLVTPALTGHERTESVLPVLNAMVQGVATRGGGLVLDVVQRVAQWREANAALEAWSLAEPRLVPGPEHARAEPIVVERPQAHEDVTLRYARQAMGAGAAVGALTTPYAGPRRALAVALSSMPKAPHAGREGFATTLGRFLALRGVVAMDRSALRRLGQVDTVLLDADVLRSRRYEPTELVLLDGAGPEQVSDRLFALFDPAAPAQVHCDGEGWALGPLEELDLAGRTGRRAADRLRQRGSERVLGLALRRRLVAVAGVEMQTLPGAQALAAAARRSGLRVVLAGDQPCPELGFADAMVPTGGHLVASVRALQADGAVVLLVSGNRRALGASDCGIGVHREGEPPAWGAHLLVGTDLDTVALILTGAGVARQVDRDSALLAASGSGIGAVAAMRAAAAQACSRGQAACNTAGGIAFCLGAWRARQLVSRPVTPAVETVPWHLMPSARVLERLRSSSDGLPEEEAASRAKGPWRTGTPRTTLPSAFIEELANPLTPVLAGGAALAAAVGSSADAALVALITAASALVGGVQRVRTERALAELTARSAVGARVRRGGRVRLVTAEDLVPGDVVLLGPEDVVPADCRLLETEGLEVDESSLTGESLPVPKDPAPVAAAQLTDRSSMLYEGTTVSAGQAVVVVVATGAATEVGRTMASAREAAPVTGVEARLSSLTRASLPVAAASAAAVAGAGLLHGRPLAESLTSAVNLAVASVPEGLPFLVNAAQLASARRLAEHGALVRNPRTIEALGRADVLCFDKTGTLTEGHLQLVAVGDGERTLPLGRLGPRHKAVLAAALRATPAARHSEPLAHQTDRAVDEGARRARVSPGRGAPRWRRTGTLPFDPSRAYHATAGRTAGSTLLSIKGAPETVLARCRRRRLEGAETVLDDAGHKALTRATDELAAAGRRVLAVAERTLRPDEELTDDAVHDLVFTGFLVLADPVRPGAAPATARLRAAGVHTILLTGDHAATAEAIAASVTGDPDQTVCTGPELDELDDDALDALLPMVSVVARCTPRHKVRIVEAFQRLGRVVAMTGDGANDAPAIRLADVGIALGRRGTPAATAAADLVIGDDRLETIVTALTEGRAMWTSVRTALAILIGGNLGEVTFSVLASALAGSSPLSARQIMLVNLLTDLAPALSIAVRTPAESTGEQLLQEGPHQSLGTALTEEMLQRGLTTALGAGLAWTAARFTGTQRRAATAALAAVVGTQLAQTLTSGGADRQVLAATIGSAAVLVGIIQTPGISRFFGSTPLGPVGWGIALAAITTATLLHPALKTLSWRLAAAGWLPSVADGPDENVEAAPLPSATAALAATPVTWLGGALSRLSRLAPGPGVLPGP